MQRTVLLRSALAILIFLAIRVAGLLGQVANGGFESNGGVGTNIFTSWTVADQPGGSGTWFVQTGTGSPLNGYPVPAPTQGTFAAMTDQSAPGSHILYQNIVVPAAGGILSFDVFIHKGWFQIPRPETLDFNRPFNRHARVDIMTTASAVTDVGAGVLQNVFMTSPDCLWLSGYHKITVPLAPFAGQTVRLRFAAVDNQMDPNGFNVGIDNVQWNEPTGKKGDFNGDAKTDILWRDTSGAVYVWLMNGTTVASGVSLPSADTGWSIVGTADFNGDGKTDILWHHTSGAVYVWLMDGTTFSSGVSLPGADPAWSIVGTADFNGDGKTDILWQHPGGTESVVWIWLMDGTTVMSGVSYYFNHAWPRWSIVGTADFNGDGTTYVLWRNDTGVLLASLETPFFCEDNPAGWADLSWSICATGDFNGDGKTDILWRHTSGAVYVWFMDRMTVVSAASLPSADIGWSIVGPK